MTGLDLSLDDFIKTERFGKKKNRSSVLKNCHGSDGLKKYIRKPNEKTSEKHDGMTRVNLRHNFARPYAEMEALEGCKRWNHDKYSEIALDSASWSDNPFTFTKTRLSHHNSFRNNLTESTNICISNLGEGVTQEDLQSIFASIGAVEECRLRLDKRGRPTGLADVVYYAASDARLAFVKYKNAKLDGRPFILQLRKKQGVFERFRKKQSSFTIKKISSRHK